MGFQVVLAYHHIRLRRFTPFSDFKLKLLECEARPAPVGDLSYDHKMAKAHWKSGTRVRVKSVDWAMTIVGYDSVGSVICEWKRGEHLARGYFNPKILALVDDAEAAKTR